MRDRHRRRLGWAITTTLLLGSATGAGAQKEPAGYWLYVDGEWKGGFTRKEECDAAAAEATGNTYECRAMYARTPVQATPGAGKASAWASSVRLCRATTRVQDTNFEAHVSAPGRAEMVGSPLGIAVFRRCLTEQGHVLLPSTPPRPIR